MKNILLLVHDDAGQEARLQAALDVTRAIDGHLTCIDVAQVPMIIANAYDSTGYAMVLDSERECELRNRSALEQRLAKEGVCWTWHDYIGTFRDGVLETAGMADLIVLNRKLDAAALPDMRALAADVIVNAHKPVLAVPDKLAEFRVTGRALIAWDGSAAATAALQAANPLLKLASAVRLFSVQSYKSETDVNEAASYLSRHGIHAEIQHVYDDRRPVAELIMEECDRWGADWCLMGGYGHSRLREALVGGVTRQMLSNSRLPLVLAH